ncbi:hypothetical protein MTR_2g041210 [Medicago truncatula]|uniref:Uncharacterized protein n=1 Tax=Medicago truncatula TaxID=3880 RepID=A0A072V660_MEDTR|nr:hypothetical protein MTR_2g041210 [Medicago truncatula]
MSVHLHQTILRDLPLKCLLQTVHLEELRDFPIDLRAIDLVFLDGSSLNSSISRLFRGIIRVSKPSLFKSFAS